MSKQIEQIRAEIERRISKNTFGAKLELIDILAWLDQLPAQPIPSDIQEAARKYADEQLLGHNRELAESGHSRHFKMGYVCFVGYEIEAAFADGMLAERERLASCPTITGWVAVTGWVARDANGEAYFYPRYKPTRDKSSWFGMTGVFLEGDPFPALRWEDEPKPVRVIIEEIKEEGR